MASISAYFPHGYWSWDYYPVDYWSNWPKPKPDEKSLRKRYDYALKRDDEDILAIIISIVKSGMME